MTSEKLQMIDRLLETYGLSGFRTNVLPSSPVACASDAALIRTLALQPDLLLLDEPFSALDYQARLNVAEDIYSILRTENKSAVLVTHDISEAISFCDRIIVLTGRPGHVKKMFRSFLSVEEKTPLKARAA